VFKLGEGMGYKPGAKLKYMALGQGMGPKAAEVGCSPPVLQQQARQAGRVGGRGKSAEVGRSLHQQQS